MRGSDCGPDGREDDFAVLFEQYKNLVYKTAYLLLNDAGEAEDALQEVFCKVYRALPTYNPRKGSFSTWLYRITVNYCLNCRRKRRPVLLSLDRLLPLAENASSTSMAEDAVRLAVGRLSEKLRAVVVLRFYWELPHAEIAQILNVPLGTVKSRLSLALETLRRELTPDTETVLALADARGQEECR